MYKYYFMNRPLQKVETLAALFSLSHGMSYGMDLLTAKEYEGRGGG